MYVQTGLGRQKRKGFGDTTGANCPGDPSCPGYVAPGSADYQTSLLQEILANQVTTTPTPTTGTLTSWLNANGTTVAIGAAVLLGVMLFARAGR